jgi:hypothetical protein
MQFFAYSPTPAGTTGSRPGTQTCTRVGMIMQSAVTIFKGSGQAHCLPWQLRWCRRQILTEIHSNLESHLDWHP